jgi:hypothetical protein
MTSKRQRQANRSNAKSSTGPKTQAGKARSAQNALCLGLSLPIWKDPRSRRRPRRLRAASRVQTPMTQRLNLPCGLERPKPISTAFAPVVGL